MKRLKRAASFIMLLILGMTTIVSAQTDKGTMEFEITDISSDNPQVAAMADMLKGNQTTVYFMGEKSITKMNMMGGMVKIDLKVSEDKSTDMLMDMMGQKLWVSTTKLEADRLKAGQDNPMEEMDITYDKEDKKTVAGYECYKMMVSFPDSEGASLEAYVTDQINIKAPIIQGVEMDDFKGFPLEYNFNNGMMTMSVAAKTFEPTVDESVFTLETGGYQKLTMQEFMDMMSSMGGGGGFGF